MDTKLKKASYSLFTKVVAFLLVIMCFGVLVTTFERLSTNSAVRYTNKFEPLIQPNFVNSSELYNYQINFSIGLNNLLKFKNEEYVKQGNTIDNSQFENQKRNFFNLWYNQGTNEYIENRNDIIYNQFKEQFEIENADRINELHKEMIDEQLRGFYSLLQKVNNKEGLYFYATDGENTYTNVDKIEREYFEGFKAYLISDKDGVNIKPNNQSNTAYLKSSQIDNKIYIAVTNQYIAKRQAEWNTQRIYLENGLTIIACAVSLLLIAFVYLLWRAGRKEDDENTHLSKIDKLYTDINITAILGVVLMWLALSVAFLRSDTIRFVNEQPVFWLVMLFNIISCSVELTLLLSLVRHFKNKTLIQHSLTYKIFKRLKSVIQTIFNSGPLSFKIIYYAIFKAKSLSDVIKAVQEIKNGNLEYKIQIKDNGDLGKFAYDINSIADGIKNTVAKEIKSERMKSELITNVSHDLKTPLTSIINYVDLLSKEKLSPGIANDYVAVLKQKSEKLKTLTEDLFEISKVQSGNISVDLEKIDISVLVKQTLAEFDDQISASELEFKVNIQNDNTFIMGDGKKLSRVFENLIINILKYSLKNTRVYIDVFADKNSVIIEFKNIANYEMNFKEDEILERFVRGDKSRTTDGNGLGLAIAESYVCACGGNMKVSVDGDLFKATIKFEKA